MAQKKKQQVQKKQSGSVSTTIGLNVLFLLLSFVFIKGLVMKQEGYGWALNMLKGNMETIRQYPDLTVDERNSIKLGASFNFLKYLRENTPENAVIYLPAQSAFFPAGVKSPFTGEPFNKLWATRFLYPRKIVTASEMGHNDYSDKLTHVAIVHGVGLDMLPYQVPQPFDFGVLPIHQDNLPQKK
jgi:hypothetical protein